MNANDKLQEIRTRAVDLARQLETRAKLVRHFGLTDLANELDRMKQVEVDPIIALIDDGEQEVFHR